MSIAVNSKKYIRNPDRVKGFLKEMGDDTLVTTKGCKIYAPARFLEKNLAQLSPEVYVCGILAVVVEDTYYSVLIVNAMVGLSPTHTHRVSMDGEEYLEFVFDPGSVVINNLNLVMTDTLTYRIYDEIFSNGHVPWYMGYEDLARIYQTAKEHADANVGRNHVITELIVSLISRDRDDRSKYKRQTIVTKDDLVKNPPIFVPLKSVHYSATNTINKLGGNYFDEGVKSAIVSPSTRIENIEKLVRS